MASVGRLQASLCNDDIMLPQVYDWRHMSVLGFDFAHKHSSIAHHPILVCYQASLDHFQAQGLTHQLDGIH